MAPFAAPRLRGEALSRSYGRCIAEFLKLSYLDRLSILNPPSSVRFGTVTTKLSLDAFLVTRITILDPHRCGTCMHHTSRTLTDLPIKA
jgi:hypothetical protein